MGQVERLEAQQQELRSELTDARAEIMQLQKQAGPEDFDGKRDSGTKSKRQKRDSLSGGEVGDGRTNSNTISSGSRRRSSNSSISASLNLVFGIPSYQ